MTNMSLWITFLNLLFGSMKQYRDKKLLEAIAKVAKELRKEKGDKLTQEGVMNDFKLEKNITIHIGRIETGATNLSVSQLRLLCEYYGITLSAFMKRVENKMREN